MSRTEEVKPPLPSIIMLSGTLYERFLKSDNLIVRSIKENFEVWEKKKLEVLQEWDSDMLLDNIEPKLLMAKRNETSILFDTVAIYLGFSEELINIEELKIEVTDHGSTQIGEKGNLIRCATSWKDVRAFKTLLVDRLIN